MIPGRLNLTVGTPGRGAGGDGVASERSAAFWTHPSFFPAVLEEPVLGRDLGDIGSRCKAVGRCGGVLVGNMLERPKGDEANLFSEFGSIQFGGWSGRMKAKPPADLIGHPVSNPGTGILVQKEGFQWLFGMPLDQTTNPGQRKPRILGLGRELGPGIGLVVNHDASEHAVVIEDEGGPTGLQDEMIVLLGFVVGRRDR